MKIFFKNCIQFALLLLPFFFIIAVINFTIDPYGVIRGDMKTQNIEPNQHFLKVKHIINNPTKYNSFLFGSSREGKIDTRTINDDNKWYNMGYSEGVPAEFLNDIKIFIHHEVQIKNILIGLDYASYLVSPERHKAQPLRKPYVNNTTQLGYYLFLKPDFHILNVCLKDKRATQFYSDYDIYDSGVLLTYNIDDYINSRPDEHINKKEFNEPNQGNWYMDRKKQTLNEILEIVKICNEKKIKLEFFTNPMLVNNYPDGEMFNFLDFLEQLVKITKFYDFSGINEVTTNKFYYYDPFHYRPIVGNMIIDAIFNKKDIPIKGLGSNVNKENIDSILNIKKEEIKKYNVHLNN